METSKQREDKFLPYTGVRTDVEACTARCCHKM